MTAAKKPLYKALASLCEARDNCLRRDNPEWAKRHLARIRELVKEYMPSGAGFDSGVTFDEDRSTGEKLVFHTSFHHMNESGVYNGWTTHDVIVLPSLGHGIYLRVSGRDVNRIKDYIHELFDAVLRQDVDEFAEAESA